MGRLPWVIGRAVFSGDPPQSEHRHDSSAKCAPPAARISERDRLIIRQAAVSSSLVNDAATITARLSGTVTHRRRELRRTRRRRHDRMSPYARSTKAKSRMAHRRTGGRERNRPTRRRSLVRHAVFKCRVKPNKDAQRISGRREPTVSVDTRFSSLAAGTPLKMGCRAVAGEPGIGR